MLDAKDKAGANYLTEEFSVDFIPTSKLTRLTRGKNIERLSQGNSASTCSVKRPFTGIGDVFRTSSSSLSSY